MLFQYIIRIINNIITNNCNVRYYNVYNTMCGDIGDPYSTHYIRLLARISMLLMRCIPHTITTTTITTSSLLPLHLIAVYLCN